LGRLATLTNGLPEPEKLFRTAICQVHALRALTLSGGSSVFCLALDVGVLLAVTTVVVVIAGRL
jgi:hypothetical protein